MNTRKQKTPSWLRHLLLAGLLVVLAGFVFYACGGGVTGALPAGSGGDSNPFVGTWESSTYGTVTVTSSGWTFQPTSMFASYAGSGTYKVSGSKADLYDNDDEKVGTATVSGDTLTIIVSGSLMTMTFDKK